MGKHKKSHPARKEDLPWRPNVGVALFDAQGRVLMCRRNDVDGEHWQMPQGGIDKGEDPAAAAHRELAEEIGTDKAEIIAECPDWLSYDLPDELIGKALKGKYRGQTQKWFAMRFTGTDADIRLDAHHAEFDAFQWVPLDRVVDMIVPFKRPVYERMVAAFRDLGG